VASVSIPAETDQISQLIQREQFTLASPANQPAPTNEPDGALVHV